MSKLVVLRRCATLEEALVVDSLLQDGGFLSSTPMRYHAQNDWGTVPAFNGTPVFIPEAELHEAGAYLIEMRATAKERLEGALGEVDHSKFPLRWGRALTMLILYFGGGAVIVFPLIFLLAALPIDWAALNQSEGRYFFLTSTKTSPWGGAGHRLDGILYVAFIILFLIWDITDVSNKKHENNAKDTPS